jgi:DNA-binding MarR family transcriptional regulator
MQLPTYIIGTVQTKAYRLLREHVYSVLTQFDLTPTYWSMLGIITQAQDGIRHTEIARAMHVKPPLITIMARQLEEQGIIQKVQNQFDGRAKLLAVTPKGKSLIKMVEADLHKTLDELLLGLDEQELVTYHKVLTTIIANDERLQNRGI